MEIKIDNSGSVKLQLKKTQLTFQETFSIVKTVVDACFDTDENGVDIDYIPELETISLQCAFYENYIGELSEDFDEAFATYMSVDIYSFDFNTVQWNGIKNSVREKIEFRKQKLLDSQSSQSQMFKSISTLFFTLNSKAEQIDMKKIDKIIKKLNVNEIMKAYQKSGIGDGIRDKSIQEQSQTLKEKDKIITDLKNQISARNVLADGK